MFEEISPSVFFWEAGLDLKVRLAWKDLVDGNPQAPVFWYPEWMDAAVRAGFAQPWKTVMICDGNQPLVLLPLQRRSPWTATLLPNMNPETPLLLLRATAEDKAWNALMAWLRGQPGLGLVMLGRYRDQQQLARCQQIARDHGLFPYTRPVYPVVCLSALPASWEEYLDSLSASRRYAIRRTEHSLLRTCPGAEVIVLTDPQACTHAVEDLMTLSRLRFHKDATPSIFERTSTCAFYREAVQWAAGRGFLTLHQVRIGGNTVAAATAIHVPGQQTAFYHTVGRNPHGLPNNIAPGIIVLASVIRWAIARGAGCLMLGQGTSSYKLAMGGQESPQWELFVARSSHAAAWLSKVDAASQLFTQLPNTVRTWRYRSAESQKQV